MSFFDRLMTRKSEESFVDGCRALYQGNHARALRFFSASNEPDCKFLAGLLHLKNEQYGEAVGDLAGAHNARSKLGRLFQKYDLSAIVSLPITPEVNAKVAPDEHGVLLALTEAYQGLGRWEDATRCLKRLRSCRPNDPVVNLSLIEIVQSAAPSNKTTNKQIIRMVGDIENDSPIHAALLYYKARALRSLGLHSAARAILSAVLRRKKHRPQDLLHAARYERARCYEDEGKPARARADYEKIYAESPDYEDVAERLGL